MFEIFKKMFLSNNQSKQDVDDNKIATESDQENIGQDLKNFIAEQERYQSAISYKNYLYDYIIKAGIFNKENYGLLYDYIINGNSIFDKTILLTTEEKRQLGLNTRQKIPMGLLMFFDTTKIKGLDLKMEIKKVYLRAAAKARLIEDCENAKKLGVKQIMYHCCNDERDCQWCKDNNGRIFFVQSHPVDIVLDGCKCDYNRSYFQCVITGDDPDCLLEVKLKEGVK